jgi:hypothetical protein
VLDRPPRFSERRWCAMSFRCYYVVGSDGFFTGGYDPTVPYRLNLAVSEVPDNLAGKRLDFSAVALRLGKALWDKHSNRGILNYSLNLTNPIIVPGQDPIPPQIVQRLNYAFAFQDAEKQAQVGGMNFTPIFSGVSVSDNLSVDGNPCFCFEISLAKSGGSNTNAIIEMVSKILGDPAVSAGLIAAMPVLGIASAVFEIVRNTFFGTGQAKPVWKPTRVQFRGTSGTGIPLKAGRYAFISTRASAAEVVQCCRYADGKLMDSADRGEEIRNANQFYMDIYAR